jgi:hypothetical protein
MRLEGASAFALFHGYSPETRAIDPLPCKLRMRGYGKAEDKTSRKIRHYAILYYNTFFYLRILNKSARNYFEYFAMSKSVAVADGSLKTSNPRGWFPAAGAEAEERA